MLGPRTVIVEFMEAGKLHTHVFTHVFADSRGDALNLVQGFMDLFHPNAQIKKLSCNDNTKVRDYDAIRPFQPYRRASGEE